MKQTHRRDDVEVSGQLLNKGGEPHDSREDHHDHDHDHDHDSSENFDVDYYDANDAYSYWYTQYRPSPRHMWRRMKSLSMPAWLPVRKLNQLNPRYLIFIVVVSLAITVLIVNPYGLSRSTESAAAESADTTETEAASPSKPNPPKDNDQFCTTWPVDKDGNYDLDAQDRSNRVESHSIAPSGGWRKPKGLKIIGMVFFGRKRYVDILDCYLQQNLASNGGYLDEVWFMIHTEVEEDLDWLNTHVANNPDYKVVGGKDYKPKEPGYGYLWNYATGNNTIYVKIDDDIIYIHEDAIPQLVHTRLAVPHAFAVSAHLVNSPITGVEQFHHNAIYPFVPDPNRKPSHNASETWRLSGLDRYPKDKLDKLKEEDSKKIMYPEVPYRGHPFVLLSEDNFDLLHTSMGRYDQDPGGEFIAWSPMWRSWAMAAQQQYSLLYNLEKNRISRYFFGRPAAYPADAKGPEAGTTTTTIPAPGRKGEVVRPPPLGGEQVFDTQFRRYNLNFCAVWGSDVAGQLPIAPDDEDAITKTIPRKTGRPFVIDTRAVVGHFSFFTQAEGVGQTDLLDRWRAFANEAVCAPDNRKTPWDLRCPGFEGDEGASRRRWERRGRKNSI